MDMMQKLLKNLLYTNGTTNWKNVQESPEYELCSVRPSKSQHDENAVSFHNHDIRSVHDNT
jgi:hypothetical protein